MHHCSNIALYLIAKFQKQFCVQKTNFPRVSFLLSQYYYHPHNTSDTTCGFFFPNTKKFRDTSWMSYNLTQFWHCAVSSHRLNAQSHKTLPYQLQMPITCPGCYLCFWLMSYKSGIPMILLGGSITLPRAKSGLVWVTKWIKSVLDYYTLNLKKNLMKVGRREKDDWKIFYDRKSTNTCWRNNRFEKSLFKTIE